MFTIPVLKQGPFSLPLDKAVQYIVIIFKGASCGVCLASGVAIVVLLASAFFNDLTDEEISYMNRELIMAFCICAFSVAYFFLCGYLQKGVEDRDRTWIFPWFLVTSVVGFVLIILFFLSLSNGFDIIQLILPIIIALLFYCDLVVYSLYIDLGINFVPETPPTQVVPS